MDKKEEIIRFLKKIIAETLKCSESDIKSNGNIHQLGLSSLNAVIISGELEDEFKTEIDPMIMFESETIEEIADKIISNV